AVISEIPPGGTEPGDALTANTIHGSKSAPVPVTAPQPVLPGPALQPHQLFSRSDVTLFAFEIAVVVAMMRLKCAVTFANEPCSVTPVAMPVMVEPVATMLCAFVVPSTRRPLPAVPLTDMPVTFTVEAAPGPPARKFVVPTGLK